MTIAAISKSFYFLIIAICIIASVQDPSFFMTMATIITALAITHLLRYFLSKSRYTLGLYYLILIMIGLALIGRGGVANDAYLRLEQFQALEQAGQLAEAKQHPESYNSMFRIDLEQFDSAQTFEQYIKDNYDSDNAAIEKSFAIIWGTEAVLMLKAFFKRLKLLRRKRQWKKAAA